MLPVAADFHEEEVWVIGKGRKAGSERVAFRFREDWAPEEGHGRWVELR